MNNSMITSFLKLPRLALAFLLGMTAVNVSAADTNAADKRKMLSKHETVAQFVGVAYRKCLGATGACPDKCGSSGDMATFRILKYVAYEKPGQYGDKQQKQYQFLVVDNLKTVKVSAEVKATIDSLKPDDYLRLDWQHDYVTKGGSSFPERTVTQIKRITRDEADQLTGGVDNLPKADASSK